MPFASMHASSSCGKVSPQADFFSNENFRAASAEQKTLATAVKTAHRLAFFFLGEISKWLKGVDCKSIRFSVRGFESLSHHHSKKPANADKQSVCGLFREETRKGEKLQKNA